jgi:hypothetical protein
MLRHGVLRGLGSSEDPVEVVHAFRLVQRDRHLNIGQLEAVGGSQRLELEWQPGNRQIDIDTARRVSESTLAAFSGPGGSAGSAMLAGLTRLRVRG